MKELAIGKYFNKVYFSTGQEINDIYKEFINTFTHVNQISLSIEPQLVCQLLTHNFQNVSNLKIMFHVEKELTE